ncbi:MAG: hypothetical protein ACI8W8_000606 [Rhodothermales bacterium]|jgi:hypothetical protein
MRLALSFLLLSSSLLAADSAKLKIEIIGNDWDASHSDIRPLLGSAAHEIWRHFPKQDLPPIRVSRRQSGPIVLYDRAAGGAYQVKLDTGGTFWAQYSYQFAHEFCHILCNYRPENHPNKWFEEAICELASLYTLRAMGETWKTNAPYNNWRSFAPKLRSYAQERIDATETPDELSVWYRKQAKALRNNAGIREKNNVVAVNLLPLVEANPEHWRAVAYLNAARAYSEQSFEAYLRNWHTLTPAAHKPFIAEIATRFGFTF